MCVIVVLASLTAVLIFVLSVPIEMSLRADVYGKPRFRLKLSWLFGLVHTDLAGRKKTIPEKKDKAQRYNSYNRNPANQRSGKSVQALSERYLKLLENQESLCRFHIRTWGPGRYWFSLCFRRASRFLAEFFLTLPDKGTAFF